MGGHYAGAEVDVVVHRTCSRGVHGEAGLGEGHVTCGSWERRSRFFGFHARNGSWGGVQSVPIGERMCMGSRTYRKTCVGGLRTAHT